MSRHKFGPVTALSLLFVAAQVTGCKKEEPPPPLPTAAPVATPPPAPLQLKAEDAGAPKPVESAKPVGHGSGSGALTPCCNALAQNANSAPDPTTKTMMTAAAEQCRMLAKNGATSVGTALSFLRGLGVPAACK